MQSVRNWSRKAKNLIPKGWHSADAGVNPRSDNDATAVEPWKGDIQPPQAFLVVCFSTFENLMESVLCRPFWAVVFVGLILQGLRTLALIIPCFQHWVFRFLHNFFLKDARICDFLFVALHFFPQKMKQKTRRWACLAKNVRFDSKPKERATLERLSVFDDSQLHFIYARQPRRQFAHAVGNWRWRFCCFLAQK